MNSVYKLILLFLILFACSNCFEIQNNETNSDLKFLGESNKLHEIVGAGLKSSIGDNILPGMGFSTDTDSTSSTTCYNYSSMTKGNQQSVLKFDQSFDSSTISNVFDVSGKFKIGYQAFGLSAEAQYFDSIKEDKYSFTVNYYQKVLQTTSFTYSYSKENILSEQGKKIYDNGQNNMFRVFCGDHLLKSYQEGAGIIFSLTIKFESYEEKNKFTSSGKIDFGSFANISSEFKKDADKLNVNGIVRLNAFQFGGDPTKLSKLLSSSLVSCDLKSFDKCKETLNKMISYVSEDFPTQFIKDAQGFWLSPLVTLGKIEKDFLVSDFGLSLAPSFVTKELSDARRDIVIRLRKINYYLGHFKTLKSVPDFNHVDFSQLITRMESQLEGIAKGKEIFLYPNRGVAIYKELISELNTEDLERQILEKMKTFNWYVQYDDQKKFRVFPFNQYKLGYVGYIGVHDTTTEMCIPFAKSFEEFIYVCSGSIYKVINQTTTWTAKTKYEKSCNCYKGEIVDDWGLFKSDITGQLSDHKYSIKEFDFERS